MKNYRKLALGMLGLAAVMVAAPPASAQLPARPAKPNILVIMGDDIGWFNLGAYHGGMMLNATPNLDTLATQGMRLTDYYAEASCTAGRANFITGELPIRTGLTTVGQAGSALGMPDAAPTIANALRAQGYATGQFGKNHLGDRNAMLPTAHGFDEFFGYLYHLNAMEDPFYGTYPPDWRATVGPRDLIHSLRPMSMIQRNNPAGEKSANRRSSTKVRCRPNRSRASNTVWVPSTR
jgi:arylsulfatase A-like enzyme